MSRSRVINLANLQQFTAINVLSDPGAIPGPKVIPQCVEVRLQWTQDDGKTAFNVLHARYPGTYPGSVGLANSLFTALSNLLTSSGLATQLVTATSLHAVDLRDLNTPNNPLVTSSAAVTFTGSGTIALPNEVAAVLTFRTALAGNAFRGRMFVPGWDSVAMGPGNTIANAAGAALAALANGLLGVFTAQSLTLCLGLGARAAYTGSTGRQHPARAARTVDVTSVVLRDNHWDSQRRRGLK